MEVSEDTMRGEERAGYDYLKVSSDGDKKLWADLNAWMHMQAQQWEPAGRRLLAELGDGTGKRVVDIGCGPLGWLPLLSRWVGPTGEVVGTEVVEDTAGQARLTVLSEGLSNVTIMVDDVFDSRLPEHSFDMVHSRLMLGSIGRPDEQMATYRRLLKPGGLLVLEDLDMASYRFNPGAPANERLIQIVGEWVGARGRDVNVGRRIRTLLRPFSDNPIVRANVLMLPPGHVYRALSLVGATSIREGLVQTYGAQKIDTLLSQAEEELRDPELWCTSFLLIQGYTRIDA
jgi:SAM-dependent methyltransferase